MFTKSPFSTISLPDGFEKVVLGVVVIALFHRLTQKKEAPSPYPDAVSHGALEKVTDDIYVVRGGHIMMKGMVIELTMTVIKQGSDLVIVNAMRVSPEMEAEIQKLGKIKHLVQICGGHGTYDQYYIDTFKTTFWDLPGRDEAKTPKGDKILSDGGDFPVKGAKVMKIKDVSIPEFVVWLPHGGGTLVTADFIQNGRPKEFENFMGSVFAHMVGFNNGRCSCPPLFRLGFNTGVDMYANNGPRIMALDFKNICPGHGPAQIGDAKEDLKEGFAMIKTYKVWKCEPVAK